MSEGDKHDQDKARWDLLPMRAVSDIVNVLTYGAKKYAPNNWRKVEDARARYYAAALRHLVAWWMGEERDKESGLPHLAHAGCCLIFLSELGAGECEVQKWAAVLDVERRHVPSTPEELEREEGAGPAKPAYTIQSTEVADEPSLFKRWVIKSNISELYWGGITFGWGPRNKAEPYQLEETARWVTGGCGLTDCSVVQLP